MKPAFSLAAIASLITFASALPQESTLAPVLTTDSVDPVATGVLDAPDTSASGDGVTSALSFGSSPITTSPAPSSTGPPSITTALSFGSSPITTSPAPSSTTSKAATVPTTSIMSANGTPPNVATSGAGLMAGLLAVIAMI